MFCEKCSQEIEYEVTVLDICSQEFKFCDKECRDSFIDEWTTVEDVETCN